MKELNRNQTAPWHCLPCWFAKDAVEFLQQGKKVETDSEMKKTVLALMDIMISVHAA